MRHIKSALMLMLAMFMLLTGSAFAALENDSFVPCDADGNITGSPFTKAAISIDGIYTGGDMYYYGVDVGIFRMLEGNQGSRVFIQRIPTDGSKKVEITNFGSKGAYQDYNIYAIGYRVLYKPVVATGEGNDILVSMPGTEGSNQVIPYDEDQHGQGWRIVQNSYFKINLAPVAISANPPNNSTNLGEEPVFTFTFSDNIVEGTAYGNITLKNSAGTAVGFTKAVEGNTLTIDPTDKLPDSNYTIFIPGGAVKGTQAGIDFPMDFTYSFTAGPIPDLYDKFKQLPTNVGTTSVVIPFSENVKKKDEAAYKNITIKKDGVTIPITSMTIIGRELIFTPTTPLQVNATYTLNIPAYAIQDMVGNYFNDKTFIFAFSTGTSLDTSAASLLVDIDRQNLNIGEVINYSEYNNTSLSWYYVGNGYFIMTKESYEHLNKEMAFNSIAANGWATSSLNSWLNQTTAGGFFHDVLNNDSRIAYVTVPSANDYELLSSICLGEGNGYTKAWWLRTPNPGTDSSVYAVLASGAVKNNIAVNTGTGYFVRPAIRLKVEKSGSSAGNVPVITVSKNKPFEVYVQGEMSGAGTDIKFTNINVVQAKSYEGYSLITNHPEKPAGYNTAGLRTAVMADGREIYINVIDPPTPGTLTKIKFEG